MQYAACFKLKAGRICIQPIYSFLPRRAAYSLKLSAVPLNFVIWQQLTVYAQIHSRESCT